MNAGDRELFLSGRLEVGAGEAVGVGFCLNVVFSVGVRRYEQLQGCLL